LASTWSSCGPRFEAGRIVYASNHRSHIDYLVEPLVLDDNGIRPPIIAAGINLFGGPLGLMHTSRHGGAAIRRNTRDPLYLITLKATSPKCCVARLLLLPEVDAVTAVR
jgi:glycerol-3-phosphate O-acyltransferase